MNLISALCSLRNVTKGLFLIVALAAFLPQTASAQAGYRVCLDDSRSYVMKIDKNDADYCNSVATVESDADLDYLTWDNPLVMTCEDFSETYTKWEWDACYDMSGTGYTHCNNDGGVILPPSCPKTFYAEGKLYQVAMVPREEDRKVGTACGASICSISVSWSQTDSFGYNAGASVSQIFGADIGFSASTSDGTGGSVSCSWKEGLTPGVFLNRNVSSFTNTNPLDLLSAMSCESKGIAKTDLQKESVYERCAGNFQALNQNTSNLMLVNSDGGYYTGEYPYTQNPTTYSTASGYFESDKTQYDDPEGRPLWPNTSYSFQPSGYPHLVRCGLELYITTPANVWRDYDDIVQWKVQYRYEFARES